VLVLGPSPTASAAGAPAAAVDAVRRLVAAGAKPRVAATVVAELTGAGANELYRSAAVQ
jgi:16S rRNA (cytidine1402-2'-O)-methyltransferase